MNQQNSFQCLTNKLPLDKQGFTKSFSIHNFNPEQVADFYKKFGLVIFDDILDEKQITLSVNDLWQDVIEGSSGQVKRDDPETWDWHGYLGRYGFVNDRPLSRPQLWKNRAHPNNYKAFKSLYEITSGVQSLNQPLLCLFDRGSILRPGMLNPDWLTSPIHHFDIHPWWWCQVQQDKGRWRYESSYNQSYSRWLGEGNYVPKVGNFTKFQGVLAFSDTRPGTGGFQCATGFQNCIKQWCQKYPQGTRITKSLQLLKNMQECYQRKGSILVFSRELPHNIFPNQSENFRYAQYLRMAPESTLMLTQQDKEIRKKQVKKMLPEYLNINDPICRQIFMLDDVDLTKKEEKAQGKENPEKNILRTDVIMNKAIYNHFKSIIDQHEQ